MPLRKKHSVLKKIIIWISVIAIIALMIIYFEPDQHITEIVLYQ